jgi:hypothetical protein
MNDPAQRILDFLRDIDVEIREEPISGSTFLPGIRVVAGALVVDRETCTRLRILPLRQWHCANN